MVSYTDRGRKMAFRLCLNCKKKVLVEDKICPHCGKEVRWSDNPEICRINGVDYDVSYFCNQILGPSFTGDKFRELGDVFDDLLDGNWPGFVVQVLEQKKVPKEYNCQPLSEWIEQIEESCKDAKQEPEIKCPYCGSTDVKSIGFFEGGWSAIGKNWKCKCCKSYF